MENEQTPRSRRVGVKAVALALGTENQLTHETRCRGRFGKYLAQRFLEAHHIEPCSDLIPRSALFVRVSMDGRLHRLCGHPSRRIALARCSLGMRTGET